jgi:hypothetical protein
MEKRNELRDNKRRAWSQNQMSMYAIESRQLEEWDEIYQDCFSSLMMCGTHESVGLAKGG